MARVIGLDLGSHAVKVTVYSGRLGRLEFEGHDAEPLNGSGQEALAAALECLHQRWQGDDKPTIVAAIPAERASMRSLTLPFVDKKRIDQTLPFEVEAQVPFDLEDMVLDSRVLAVGSTTSEVLVGLAPKPLVQEILDGLDHAGFDPKLLVLDGDVLGGLSGNGVQAIVDFGHSRTLVTACRGGTVVATRAFAVGSGAITAAIAAKLGCDLAEAERIKHQAVLPTDGTGVTRAEAAWDEDETQATAHPQVGSILREALEGWLSELRATLVSFEDSHGLDLDEVVATGGGSELNGLRALLADTLGVPVRSAPLEGDSNTPSPGRFALSDLLSRRGAGLLKGTTLEFRKDEFAFKGDLLAYRNLIAAGLLGTAAFLVAGAMFFGVRTVQLSRQVSGLDAEIAAAVQAEFPDIPPTSFDSPSEARAVVQEKLNTVQEEVAALEGIHSTVPPTLDLLKAISEAVPASAEARIDVDEMTITETAVTMDAETDGYETAAKIETSLQAHPKFALAKKSDERKVRDAIAFTIHIPLEGSAEAADAGAADTTTSSKPAEEN